MRLMAWHDEYPHKVYASVLLLDGKIENWKIGGSPKKHAGDWSNFWKLDRINDYTVQFTEFVVNNDKEHNEAFEKLAPEWLKQWLIADDFVGSRPYREKKNYLEIAKSYLKNSNCIRRKYACVIVDNLGDIISYGWNESPQKCKICAREGKEHNTGYYDDCPAVHAEAMALRDISIEQSRGSTLYLVCNEEDHPSQCPICRKLMDWYGVRLAKGESNE